MSDTAMSHDDFIAGLVAELRPVRPLASPLVRAAGWLAVVIAIAVAIAAFADLAAMRHRLMAVPDMWLAVVGLDTDGPASPRSPPSSSICPIVRRAGPCCRCRGLALWIGASGMGCARTWLIAGTHDASMTEATHCLVFIIGLSVPLSLLMVLMLRRGFSLAPVADGVLRGPRRRGGRGHAPELLHPFDAALTRPRGARRGGRARRRG